MTTKHERDARKRANKQSKPMSYETAEMIGTVIFLIVLALGMYYLDWFGEALK